MRVTTNVQRSMMGAGLAAIVLGLSSLPIAVHADDQSGADATQRVAPGVNSDTVARVKSAMSSNPTFDGRHVDVSMDKGRVVLSGFVQSSQAVEEATRIATKAAGDTKVVNHLTITQNYPNAP